MFNEIRGICRHCSSEVSVLVNGGEVLDVCAGCGEKPFEIIPYAGLVYVVNNPHQSGVKIGMTTKSIYERLKGLNATGVPGAFEVVALFPSAKPKHEEKKIHQKLKRWHLAKEHFELEPVEAALKCFRELNRRKPVFFSDAYRTEFELKLEIAKKTMQLRLNGKSS
ncbi:GIY-YIG nuclease family protein [Thioclava sp. F1Mire-8]|uniref:GIY-YIG nuclease family protein n=1 Tax=Thioclava sp. F1Mire-8 TaxID=1973006 RepID=UPI00143C382E|nr:GIY-YIG nuclease family protein [Thioclava sp. F1Mire-8]